MRTVQSVVVTIVLAAGLPACLSPSDARPGLRLSGETAEVPDDWSFSDSHREIALEVRAPYGLPHSVTIWCAAPAGALHVAARNPDEKHWPAWVDAHPDVRLRIDGKVYVVRLERLEDPSEIARVRAAYAAKYQLERPASPDEGPPMRYWRVRSRG